MFQTQMHFISSCLGGGRNIFIEISTIDRFEIPIIEKKINESYWYLDKVWEFENKCLSLTTADSHTKADNNKVIKLQTIANNYDTTSDSVVDSEGDIMWSVPGMCQLLLSALFPTWPLQRLLQPQQQPRHVSVCWPGHWVGGQPGQEVGGQQGQRF